MKKLLAYTLLTLGGALGVFKAEAQVKTRLDSTLQSAKEAAQFNKQDSIAIEKIKNGLGQYHVTQTDGVKIVFAEKEALVMYSIGKSLAKTKDEDLIIAIIENDDTCSHTKQFRYGMQDLEQRQIKLSGCKNFVTRNGIQYTTPSGSQTDNDDMGKRFLKLGAELGFVPQ